MTTKDSCFEIVCFIALSYFMMFYVFSANVGCLAVIYFDRETLCVNGQIIFYLQLRLYHLSIGELYIMLIFKKQNKKKSTNQSLCDFYVMEKKPFVYVITSLNVHYVIQDAPTTVQGELSLLFHNVIAVNCQICVHLYGALLLHSVNWRQCMSGMERKQE